MARARRGLILAAPLLVSLAAAAMWNRSLPLAAEAPYSVPSDMVAILRS